MATIQVGKTYVSQAGNTVKILNKETVEDAEGRPIDIYFGHVQKAVKGHEAIQGKVHKFLEDGKWKTFPGGIHDLKKALD